MSAERRSRIRIPRIRGFGNAASARHRGEGTAARPPLVEPKYRGTHRTAPKTPPAPPAPALRAKRADGGARADVERRARTSRPLGARETPLERQDPYGTRNYPPRTSRTKDPLARSRDQLAQRGGPARPHPKSGDNARQTVKAKGVARRPASTLRDPKAGATPPKPVPEQRRQPDTYGNSFASGFFGRQR